MDEEREEKRRERGRWKKNNEEGMIKIDKNKSRTQTEQNHIEQRHRTGPHRRRDIKQNHIE